ARAPGSAEQHHRLPSPRRNCVHDRRNVAELALCGVAGIVLTGTKATAVHGEDGEFASVGYVAEEFLLDGTAAAYEAEPGAELTVDGKWRVRPSSTAPFRTRVLVVRPVDRARF